MKNNSPIKLILKLILSAAMLFAIIYYVGPEKLIGRILSLDPVYIPLIVCAYVGVWITGSFNLLILINGVGRHKLPFRYLFRIFLHVNSWGFLVPGKLGELSIIVLLKPFGVHSGEGMYYFFIDKLISLSLYLGLAGVLSITLSYNFIGIVLFSLSLASILSGALLGSSPTITSLVVKISRGTLKDHIESFQKTGRALFGDKKQLVLMNFLVSVIKLALQSSVFFLLLSAMGTPVPWSYVIMVTSCLHLASLIPITFSGIGLSETISVFLYGAIGVPLEAAVTAALLANILSSILAVIILLFIKAPKPDEYQPVSGG